MGFENSDDAKILIESDDKLTDNITFKNINNMCNKRWW